MIQLLFISIGFLITTMVSEIVLDGNKLQTGLGKILIVHGVIVLLMFSYLRSVHQIGFLGLFIFWVGGFLSWFGIRSHVESSILLRMIYLLRFHPMTETELLSQYESQYGESMRVAELVRTGLVRQDHNKIILTKKGRFIHRNASRLK